MTDSPPRTDVGFAIGKGTVASLVLAATIVVGGLFWWASTYERPGLRQIRISTGNHDGTYHALGEALRQTLLRARLAGTVELLPSAGSLENAARIGAQATDFALVQSDTPPAESARLVAKLYTEVLHIVLRPDSSVQSIRDLENHTISLGPANSGTRAVAERVLEQFDIEPDLDIPLTLDDSWESLEAGTVEATFVLTAAPSTLVDNWCRQGATLLSLGNVDEAGNLADALHARNSALVPTILPRGLYGRSPAEPIQTIGVSAMLVACESTPDDWVRDVTEHLFEERIRLAASPTTQTIFRRLREDYRPGQFLLPFHRGAAEYYEREEPPFLVEHAEATSLVITLLAGGVSLTMALRQWYRRQRKNRIDLYYNEVRTAACTDSMTPEQLRDARAKLLEVRGRAFDDLVDEKVEADESFTIFQDYVNAEIERIDGVLRRSPSPKSD